MQALTDVITIATITLMVLAIPIIKLILAKAQSLEANAQLLETQAEARYADMVVQLLTNKVIDSDKAKELLEFEEEDEA